MKAVRVLAVDDIESNLLALEAVLQDSSVEVVRAKSGHEALQALLKDEFALILLDVQMPEMDGFETATAIRQRPKTSRVPIIFLTAHEAGPEKVARAYAVGGADFLTKPLDEDAVRAKVRVIADLWRRVDEATEEVSKEGERRLADERGRWETETLRARVTEQEKARAAEQLARLEAEGANQVKDEFLATVSHELRTPLTAILGWAATLKAAAATHPTVKRAADAIERNAKAQAKLVDDLLDISSVIAGKMRLEMGATPLSEVIAAAMERMAPTAADKEVTLEATAEPDLPEIAADPDRLLQVLTNVVSNAIKFTPRGGRVDVRAEKCGASVRLRVKDTGMGIAPQLLPHIFDRFRQGDGSVTRVHGGLGIGLSLARHLVALHGGTISAESAGEGKGATFTIVLPVPATMPADRASAGPVRTNPVTRTPLSGVRILIVDDSSDSRDAVLDLFKDAGATVFAANSAATGFEAFLAWHPDVIVSDIGMPGEDGYSLLRRIRALPAGAADRVPAAALTAYSSADDVAKAYAAGFQSHLSKPIDPAKLVATVAALVDGRLPGK